MTRKQTGKSPIWKMVLTIYVMMSIPIWWCYLMFGFPGIPQEGELLPSRHGWYPAGEWTWLLYTFYYFAVWYGVTTAVLLFMYCTQRLTMDWLFSGDPEYDAWKAGGGDPFFDTLAGPINTDDQDVKLAIPHPDLPPVDNCPHCGTELNSIQCGQCGIYWADGQWWAPLTEVEE